MSSYRPFVATSLAFRSAPLQPLPRSEARPSSDVVTLYPDEEDGDEEEGGEEERITPEEHELRLAARAAEVELRVRQEMAEHIRSLEEALPALSPVVEALESARRRILEDAAREVAELAIEMARRVVGETLHVGPEAILPLVERALEPVARDEVVRVRVDARRAAVVRRHLPPELRDRVVPEPSLGDRVVVETDGARVTACADAALEELAAAIREHAGGEGPR